MLGPSHFPMNGLRGPPRPPRILRFISAGMVVESCRWLKPTPAAAIKTEFQPAN